MHFVLDVHCHTVNSGHGYSTINENAAHAASIGLTHIGISDHAPGMPGGPHINNFLNLRTLPDVIHGIRVFKGVECNIIDYDGNIDMEESVLKQMDFVIASLHRSVILPKDRAVNTRGIILAMEKTPYMHILGHPGDACYDVDMKAVIDAAARTRTIIEINNQSLVPDSDRFRGEETFIKMLELCKEYRVPVLASSDAHFCTNVGNLDRAKAVIEAAGMPENLVLNTCAEKFLNAIVVQTEKKVER